jgi:hypothetical protein
MLMDVSRLFSNNHIMLPHLPPCHGPVDPKLTRQGGLRMVFRKHPAEIVN